jgi:hypothetical protein
MNYIGRYVAVTSHLLTLLCLGTGPSGRAAAGLLGLRVRIPTEAWRTVCCECCVLSGRVLCVGLITRPGVLPSVVCLSVLAEPSKVRPLLGIGSSSTKKLSTFVAWKMTSDVWLSR